MKRRSFAAFLMAAVLTAGSLLGSGVAYADESEVTIAYETEVETLAETESETIIEIETEEIEKNETEVSETEIPETFAETEAVENETESELESETETESESETEVINDDPEAYKYQHRPMVSDEDTVDLFGNSSAANKVAKAYGVDVSQWQGPIDWPKVKAAGVDFAIIRVGYRGYAYGTLVLDQYAKANLAGAQAAGIKIGAYFFSTAITKAEAVEEAKFMINVVKDYNITYPLCYDNEGMYLIEEDGVMVKQRDYDLTARQRTDFGTAFLDYCLSQGYEALMYGNTSCFNDNKEFYITELEKKYDVWIAAYPWKYNTEVGYSSLKELQSENRILSYQRPYRIWQFSSEGRVSGISGYADINVEFYADGAATEGTLDCVYMENYLNVMVTDVKPKGYKIKTVKVSVWSLMNGSDDVVSYVLPETEKGVYAKAINLFKHHSDMGLYKVKLSYIDTDGKTHIVTDRKVTVSNHIKPTANVSGVKAESYGKNKVRLTWEHLPEAEGYAIYGINKVNSTKKLLATTATETTYIDKYANDGDYNTYWVRAYTTDIDGKKLVGPGKTSVQAKGGCPAVTNLKATAGTGKVTLSWSASIDAAGYRVYKRNSAGVYKEIGTTTSLKYVDKTASTKAKNYYKIYPYYLTTKGGKVTGRASVTVGALAK